MFLGCCGAGPRAGGPLGSTGGSLMGPCVDAGMCLFMGGASISDDVLAPDGVAFTTDAVAPSVVATPYVVDAVNRSVGATALAGFCFCFCFVFWDFLCLDSFCFHFERSLFHLFALLLSFHRCAESCRACSKRSNEH